MAAILELRRARSLLEEAIERGCSWIWANEGRITLGPTVGQPLFELDFVQERLVELDRSTAAVTPRCDSLAVERTFSAQNQQAPVLYEPYSLAHPLRRTGSYSLTLEGRIIPAPSYQALLLSGLQALEFMRPGTLEKLSRDRGRTKRVVARQRDLLYRNPRLAKYAKQIDGGWWVATNNNGDEVEKFIRRAAFHAGVHVEIQR